MLDRIKDKVHEINNDLNSKIFSNESEFFFIYLIVCWFGFIFMFQYLHHSDYLSMNTFIVYMLLCGAWYVAYMAMTSKQRKKELRKNVGRRYIKNKKL